MVFKSSIFVFKLHSFARIRSNFSAMPSDKFKAAITSSSTPGLVMSGELDSFARFLPVTRPRDCRLCCDQIFFLELHKRLNTP